MKHTIKNLSDSKVEVHVELTQEEIAEHHAAAVKKMARDVKVSGFRKGHVPLNVAEKHLDPVKVADEAVNNAINAVLNEIIRGEKIRILDQPTITVTKFVPAQVLEFTAGIEVMPTIKLSGIDKLKTKKGLVKIEAKDVDDVLGRLQKSSMTKEEVSDRAAKLGDEVDIDFVGTKDGVEFPGGSAKNYALELGSNSFIPGFEDGVVGHKIGDEFDIPLTFPRDYGAKDLAGAKVNFHVTLNKIREIKSPELNDEFAVKLSPEFKKLDDLKNDIKREVTARAEFEAQRRFEDALVEELADKADFDVPGILVEDQLVAAERNFTQNLLYQGMTVEQYLEQNKFKDREDWIARELRPVCEKTVRKSLVLAQLVEDWNISVTEEEIAAKQAQIIAQYNDPKLKDRFNSPEAKRQIAQQIISDKTLQKLAGLNTK
ncbi:trigger factor [Candidatus Saccharibacteria bacterium]|nr:trigger factor [Candidatus Saccharibacteria bacterium]MCL1962860.1 trigger factor [Candidatus Saccharibacteria bacterium]